MGIIKVIITGSFGGIVMQTDAEDGSHAIAIQRAIQFLNFKLKDAIVEDHRLHELGEHPALADYGRGQDQSGSHP